MKTVLITGTSRGIGKATAEKFLQEGWRVIGTSTSGNSGSITDENYTEYQLQLDDRSSIDSLIQKLKDENIKPDLLINNAATLVDRQEMVCDIENLRKTLEVNLFGTITLTEELIDIINDKGQIINISSIAGSLSMTSDPGYPSYRISKAALNMYTRTLAERLRGKVRVSCVHPGWVKTDMGGDEAPKMPEESAQDIYKLAISDVETGKFWQNGTEIHPW